MNTWRTPYRIGLAHHNYIPVRKDYYERLVGIAKSAYLHTGGTFYGGNQLAEKGLRDFLLELGEWDEELKTR